MIICSESVPSSTAHGNLTQPMQTIIFLLDKPQEILNVLLAAPTRSKTGICGMTDKGYLFRYVIYVSWKEEVCQKNWAECVPLLIHSAAPSSQKHFYFKKVIRNQDPNKCKNPSLCSGYKTEAHILSNA